MNNKKYVVWFDCGSLIRCVKIINESELERFQDWDCLPFEEAIKQGIIKA